MDENMMPNEPDMQREKRSCKGTVYVIKEGDTLYKKDAKNSKFSVLKLRVIKSTKQTNTLKWTKATGADGYVLYGNECGVKNKMIYIKSFNKKTTKWVHAKLKKGTYYKYYMAAYKIVNGKKKVLSLSRTIHVPTLGGNYTDIKGVKTNKTKITLTKGKKFKLVASEIKKLKSKNINRHVIIRFESANTKIATVSAKGVIKAKKKGTCYVYAYAQNGTYKKVKVTVK